jgi:hypothetical protein
MPLHPIGRSGYFILLEGTIHRRGTYDGGMSLTDQERARIREEEWVRLQAQEDFNRHRQKTPWSVARVIALASAFAGLALLLLFGLARTH